MFVPGKDFQPSLSKAIIHPDASRFALLMLEKAVARFLQRLDLNPRTWDHYLVVRLSDICVKRHLCKGGKWLYWQPILT